MLGKSPKLQATDITDPSAAGFHLHSGKFPRHIAVEGRSISFEDLANYLADHYHDRLIVDATLLEGVYDFSVDYEVDSKVADPAVPFAEARSSLMDGLAAALGLKIESGRRAPVEVLVTYRFASSIATCTDAASYDKCGEVQERVPGLLKCQRPSMLPLLCLL